MHHRLKDLMPTQQKDSQTAIKYHVAYKNTAQGILRTI